MLQRAHGQASILLFINFGTQSAAQHHCPREYIHVRCPALFVRTRMRRLLLANTKKVSQVKLEGVVTTRNAVGAIRHVPRTVLPCSSKANQVAAHLHRVPELRCRITGPKSRDSSVRVGQGRTWSSTECAKQRGQPCAAVGCEGSVPVSCACALRANGG